MTIVKKLTAPLTALAAVTLTAATLAAGPASAAGPGTPSIESLPIAGVQDVHHGFSHRRCFGFHRALPRRLVRIRVRHQGFRRIRGLFLRRGGIVLTGHGVRVRPAIYIATASRAWGSPYRRYRLRINACTGRVLSVRGPIYAYYGGY